MAKLLTGKDVECPRCKRKPGQRCLYNGRTEHVPHHERIQLMRLIRDYYLAGRPIGRQPEADYSI